MSSLKRGRPNACWVRLGQTKGEKPTQSRPASLPYQILGIGGGLDKLVGRTWAIRGMRDEGDINPRLAEPKKLAKRAADPIATREVKA